jgi:alkanesulfonate monooxygenase SsuD/methylene tetrahydromethanopterin reductase-like flavin-dependent oxidoreductase (luciferase family)
MVRLPWVAQADSGVRFGIQAFAPRGHADPIPTLIGAAKTVERLGFDGFFLGDHPARHPDPWTCLSAIARETERVTLGSVVNCVFYRNPAYLARLASDLDHLSNGRLMLGLGIGWDQSEFQALNVSFLTVPERQAALDEAMIIVEGLWNDDPFSFEGDYFRVAPMTVRPAPVQRPKPPIMIAGGGEKTTLRQVARFADACNFGASQVVGGAATLEDIRHKLDVLRRHCDEVEREYDEILRTYFTGWLVMAPDEAALKAKIERFFPNGSERARAGMLVDGTPDAIIQHYRERAEAGIQYFVVQTLDATDTETLELLANDVMPYV